MNQFVKEIHIPLEVMNIMNQDNTLQHSQTKMDAIVLLP